MRSVKQQAQDLREDTMQFMKQKADLQQLRERVLSLHEENERLKASLDKTKTGLEGKLEELKTEYNRRLLDETNLLRTELHDTTESKGGLEAQNAALTEKNTRLKALLQETKTGLEKKLEELKTEYDRHLLDETEHLRIQLRATTDSKSGLELENKALKDEITTLQEQISELNVRGKKYKETFQQAQQTSRRHYDKLNNKYLENLTSLGSKAAELKECNQRNEYLLKKQKEGKTKLRRLKVHQEVFKEGRSTSPSDVIYRGKKFIRGKLMKEQAQIEQRAREDARKLFAEQVPDAFADKKYYSTSPAIRRFMRKVKDETDEEKQAKAVRDAYRNERKARHAKRFELTLTRK